MRCFALVLYCRNHQFRFLVVRTAGGGCRMVGAGDALPWGGQRPIRCPLSGEPGRLPDWRDSSASGWMAETLRLRVGDYVRRKLLLEAADVVDIGGAGGQREFGHVDLLVVRD